MPRRPSVALTGSRSPFHPDNAYGREALAHPERARVGPGRRVRVVRSADAGRPRGWPSADRDRHSPHGDHRPVERRAIRDRDVEELPAGPGGRREGVRSRRHVPHAVLSRQPVFQLRGSCSRRLAPRDLGQERQRVGERSDRDRQAQHAAGRHRHPRVHLPLRTDGRM